MSDLNATRSAAAHKSWANTGDDPEARRARTAPALAARRSKRSVRDEVADLRDEIAALREVLERTELLRAS